MHKLSLSKTHVTGNGSLHVQVNLDDRDVGLLYLTPIEAQLLVATLKRGAAESGVDLTYNIINDDFVDEEELYYDDEVNY